MQAIWVDEGSFANLPKLRHYGISFPYFSHRDSRANAKYLQEVADAGFTPGIYSAWNWFAELAPEDYATKLDNELRRIGFKGNPALCVDIETHDVDYIVRFFDKWRSIRPSRTTYWTMEGFQGGLFSGDVVQHLVGLNLRFVPQFYRGDMSPLEHSPILDMLMQGFPGDRLDGFYDAASLPYRWRGFAFTQARLP